MSDVARSPLPLLGAKFARSGSSTREQIHRGREYLFQPFGAVESDKHRREISERSADNERAHRRRERADNHLKNAVSAGKGSVVVFIQSVRRPVISENKVEETYFSERRQAFHEHKPEYGDNGDNANHRRNRKHSFSCFFFKVRSFHNFSVILFR